MEKSCRKCASKAPDPLLMLLNFAKTIIAHKKFFEK